MAALLHYRYDSHSHLWAALPFQGIFTRSSPLILWALGTVWSQSPSTQLRALSAWSLLPARLEPALVLQWVTCWGIFAASVCVWAPRPSSWAPGYHQSLGLSPKHPLPHSGFPSRCTSILQAVRQGGGREKTPYFVDKEPEASAEN